MTAAILLGATAALEQSPRQIAEAVLTATAYGVYEASINGRPVTDSVLNPGWTAYEWRLQVQRFDVTELITASSEATVRIEALLGNGWYRGDLGFEGANANYGNDIGFLGELEIGYADGSRQLVTTDDSWTARVSDTPSNSLYHGQTIDTRLRRADTDALPVRSIEVDRTALIDQVGPLIMRQEEIKPIAVWTSPAGKTLLDFGQNLVGWIRLRVNGAAGDRDPAPTRRGAGERRARHPPAASGEGHRHLHPVRRRRRLRAHLHLPRLPVRRDHRLPRRADCR